MVNNLIILGIVFLVLCNSTSSAQPVSSNTSQLPPRHMEYFVVGMFCGECGGDCAPMYKFDCRTNRLFADHTNSYFKKRSSKTCCFCK